MENNINLLIKRRYVLLLTIISSLMFFGLSVLWLLESNKSHFLPLPKNVSIIEKMIVFSIIGLSWTIFWVSTFVLFLSSVKPKRFHFIKTVLLVLIALLIIVIFISIIMFMAVFGKYSDPLDSVKYNGYYRYMMAFTSIWFLFSLLFSSFILITIKKKISRKEVR